MILQNASSGGRTRSANGESGSNDWVKRKGTRLTDEIVKTRSQRETTRVKTRKKTTVAQIGEKDENVERRKTSSGELATNLTKTTRRERVSTEPPTFLTLYATARSGKRAIWRFLENFLKNFEIFFLFWRFGGDVAASRKYNGSKRRV